MRNPIRLPGRNCGFTFIPAPDVCSTRAPDAMSTDTICDVVPGVCPLAAPGVSDSLIKDDAPAVGRPLRRSGRHIPLRQTREAAAIRVDDVDAERLPMASACAVLRDRSIP